MQPSPWPSVSHNVTWDLTTPQEAHNVNYSGVINGNNDNSCQVISPLNNVSLSCINQSDLANQNTDQCVDRVHCINFLGNVDHYNEQSLLSSKTLCNTNIALHSVCGNNTTTMLSFNEQLSNEMLNYQCPYINVFNVSRRTKQDEGNMPSLWSSGNTSTKVPYNPVNTGGGYLYTNITYPYDHGQVLNESESAKNYSRLNHSTSGSSGGFSNDYFQNWVPHDVDFLYCINEHIPNSNCRFMFIHSSIGDKVYGWYHVVTDSLGRLTPCPEPPSGALYLIQLRLMSYDDVNRSQKHNYNDMKSVAQLAYDYYKDDQHSLKTYGCSYDTHMERVIDKLSQDQCYSRQGKKFD